MIHFNNLTLRVAQKVLLKQSTETFLKGQLVGILGANGSGKTTFLKALAGLIIPLEGEIFFNHLNVKNMSLKEGARIRAYIPANPLCHWPLTVTQVLDIKTSSNFLEKEKWIKKMELEEVRNQVFNTLSSGEKARVFLAHALLRSPQILLADELTSHLDSEYQIKIMTLLKSFVYQGNTAVIVLHQEDLAFEFCDQVYRLENQTLKKIKKPASYIKEWLPL